MKEKTISINYRIYASLSDLEDKDRELAIRAQDSQKYSYAPYSGFRVGAALRLRHGAVFGHGNQENAAYSLCLCAERSALAAASALHPDGTVEAICVSASVQQQLISPCGACRQVLCETEIRQGSPIRIFLQGPNDQWLEFFSAADLLPLPFGPQNLLGH